MPGVNPSAELSVSGSGGRAQELLIDGASNTNPESGGISFNFPAAEMFSEFKLLTSTFRCEYGRFGGGVEIYVTKSGTKPVSRFRLPQHEAGYLECKFLASNAAGRAKPRIALMSKAPAEAARCGYRRSTMAAIRRSFFMTYSKDKRPISTTPVLSTVPTAKMKQGDFSELPFRRSFTIRKVPMEAVRTPFLGNIIPKNRFSKISANIVGLIPDPTRPTLTGNYDNVKYVCCTTVPSGV